ncbi:MAG: hypothetical protein GEU75_10865 [Dehalococcoidia bacterium]|nr:hypothetical protein [Dehalococcoidia bacterium]
MTNEESLDFEDFQWDARVESHVRGRGLTPTVLHAVVTGSPKAFPNKESGRGTHMVIGPDRRSRFWTIILLQARNGRWRPITGWPSKAKEIALYKET